jgi:hypothetical protein
MTTILQNFYKTSITRAWTVGAGDFNVSTKPTVSSGYLVISPNNSNLREIVQYTATGTNAYGDFITVPLSGRGIGGTTAQTHIIGEPVRMNLTAEHWAELNAEKPTISSGIVAPLSTPVKVGDIYLDTIAKKIYFATGTSSSSDWTITN